MSINNYHISQINELYMAYLFSNKNWNRVMNGESLKQRYYDARSKLSHTEELHNISMKMYDEVMDWLKHHKKSKIKTVEYSGGGDHENPSDIILHFEDSTSLGISLKVSENKENIGFKNYSFRTLCEHFQDFSLHNLIEETDREILSSYELHDISQDKRKAFIRSNEKLKEHLSNYNDGRLFACREFIYNHLQSMKNINEYIFDKWFHLNGFEYIKVSGKVNTNTVKIEHYHSDIHDFLQSKITVTKTNHREVRIHKNDIPFFNIRTKNNSDMFCSIIKTTGVML